MSNYDNFAKLPAAGIKLGDKMTADGSDQINVDLDLDNLPDIIAAEIEVQKGQMVYAVDSGSGNTYAVTLSPVPSAYSAGMFVFMKATHGNTGAATLNVNGLGAKAIKKLNVAALVEGDIQNTGLYILVYDGTQFLITNYNHQVAVSGLTDVTITDIANNQYLKYNSTSGKWENVTVTIPTTVAALTGDVGVSNPSNGQFFKYNSTSSKWENTSVTIPTTLAGLTGDVAISEVANAQLLKYNSTTSKWENWTPDYLTASTGFKVGSNQVVGARAAHIADPTGGATTDAEARTAIGSILSALETHGLLASS